MDGEGEVARCRYLPANLNNNLKPQLEGVLVFHTLF
jgi:hypothetical protein